MPAYLQYRRRPLALHIFLFIMTIFSTFFVALSDGVLGAFWYSGGIILILLTHEMGHYLMTRIHSIPASLPYFIPFPFSIFGTLGAVIKMEGRIPNRRALFDVGVAGPVAGMVVIVPAIIIGLRFSEVVATETLRNTIQLGDSLLFSFIARAVKGPIPEGYDIVLHPLAYAGWVGLLVTALNLLPIGQLDGGHVTYSLFCTRSRYISTFFYFILLCVCLFMFVGWFLLLVLLAVFRKHPPTMNDELPLDLRRKVIGIVVLIIFVVSFTPVPFGFGKGLIPLILEYFK